MLASISLILLPFALAAPARRNQNQSNLPFNRIVAFGDNLSDNGNGSVAHCVADPTNCDNSIYGHNTWTNGPVAVSYLSSRLHVPLLDYAYGHANGGSLFGATIDNDFTQSTAKAPSSKDQIANYTANPRAASLGNSLHFLWIGANDMNLNHIATWSDDNTAFGDKFASLLEGQIRTLLDAGAKYILVPNLYPKQISPSITFYASDAVGRARFRKAIEHANQQIERAIAALPSKDRAKVLEFDVYSLMMNLWNNAEAEGFSHARGGQFCDGFSQADWDLCVTKGHGDEFFWMQYLDMTTTVHRKIAHAMARVVREKWGF
jgi:cholinesterase